MDDRQGIAVVFAEFYEELYTSTTEIHDHEASRNQPQQTMTSFTMHELNDAINQLKKKGEAAYTRGVNAVMVKHSSRRVAKTCATTGKQSHQAKRGNTTDLATLDE